jgi:hypothetical protein
MAGAIHLLFIIYYLRFTILGKVRRVTNMTLNIKLRAFGLGGLGPG